MQAARATGIQPSLFESRRPDSNWDPFITSFGMAAVVSWHAA